MTDNSQQDSPAQLHLFDMPRVHKASYWSFVKLVARSAHLPPGKVKWSSSDASSAYCTECKVWFSFKSGNSADIRKKLSEKHPEILIKARGEMPRNSAAKLVYEAIASKRKPSMPFLSPTKRAKKASPAEEEMVTRVLVNWTSNNLRPLGIIEDKEPRFFSTLIQAINGIYEMPSRRTITERLQTYAQQKRNDLKVGIVASAVFYCLTIDIWTSHTTESFLALPIHFVTAVFKIKSHTLEIVSFPGKHTGVQIANMIRSLMLKWGLDPLKLTKIVRDNGSNVVKACDKLGVDHFGCVTHSLHLVVSGTLSKTRDEIEETSLGQAQGVRFDDLAEPEPGEERWIEDPEVEMHTIEELENQIELLELETTSSSVASPYEESVDVLTDGSLDEGLLDGCLSARAVAQIMNEMKLAASETRKHVTSFRKIVTFFNKSTKGKSRLKALQKTLQPLTVIADVTTRWNSTHHMLGRLLELRPALHDFLEYIQTSVGKEEFNDVKIARPTGEMWFHIQCLDRLLVSFDGMTKLLSGETYATMPLILPSLRLLEMRLQNKKLVAKVASGHEGEPYYGPTLKRKHLVLRFFLVLLRKRFSKLPADVKSCCLLDPQFAHGKYYRDDEKAAAELFVENEALRLAGAVVVDVDLSMSVDMSSEDEDDFTSELLGLTLKASNQEHESVEDVTLRDKVKTELKIYIDKCELLEKTKSQIRAREKTKPTKLENPLKWWKSNTGDFPLLSPVVRKYFGVVATSVPSERCFSSAGNAITSHRKKLTGDNVRDIIFLHNNQASDTEDDESDASSS